MPQEIAPSQFSESAMLGELGDSWRSGEEGAREQVFDWLETPLEPRTSLIEASAGTGKTFTLAAIYVRLLLEAPAEAPLDVRKILVGTFSRAATAELRDRLRRALHEAYATLRHAHVEGRLPEAPDGLAAHIYSKLTASGALPLEVLVTRLADALRDFDAASVYTLQSFFKSVLAQNPFESGLLFSTQLEPDAEPLLQELAEDFWRRQCYSAHPLLLAVLEKSQVTPRALLKKARTLSSRGSIVINPPAEREALNRLEREFQLQLKAAAEIFAEHEQEIREALGPKGTKLDALNRPYNYSGARNAQRLDELRDFLADPYRVGGYPLDSIGYFSKGALALAVSKRPAARAEATQLWLAATPLFAALDNLLQLARIWVHALQMAFLHSAAAAMDAKNRERDIHTFSSLEMRLGEILQDPNRGQVLAKRVREEYAVCLLDEFQDTNRTQADIFFRLFSGRQLFLIGDPKQAIYEFRGADLHAYLWAKEQANCTYTLQQNFRSSQKLVQAVQSVLTSREHAFVIPGINPPDVQAAPDNKAAKTPLEWPESTPEEARTPLRIIYFDKDPEVKKPEAPAKREDVLRQMIHWMVREIQLLASSGATLGGQPLATSDIAILVNRNDTAGQVYQALQEVGIASVLASTGSVWGSKVAGEWFRVLLAISRTDDEYLLRGALLTALCGHNGTSLHDLSLQEEPWEQVRLRFRGYQEAWLKEGFGALVQRFLHGEHVRERLLHRLDGERLLVDFQHISDLIMEQVQAQELGMEGVLSFYRQQVQKSARSKTAGEKEQLRREKDEAAVQITTVHRSKGLEYPITFLVEPWAATGGGDMIYHDPERDRLVWHNEPVAPFTDDAADPEEDEEAWAAPGPHSDASPFEESQKAALSSSLRQFYVGLTRAQHRCYLLHAHAAMGGSTAKPLTTPTPPLGYLLHGVSPVPTEENSWALQHSEKLMQDLENLAARHSGLVHSDAVNYGEAPPLQPSHTPRPLQDPANSEDADTRLQALDFSGTIPANWRILSFTYLKKSRTGEDDGLASGNLVDAEEQAQQEDPVETEEPLPLPEAVEDGSGEGTLPLPLPLVTDHPWSIHQLPAGAGTGSMLHQLLERLDFTNLGGLETNSMRTLREFGLNPRFATAISECIRATLAAEYIMPHSTECSLVLRDLPASKCLAEMQFWLPVGEFLPQRLAAVIEAHADKTPEKRFLPSLAAHVRRMGQREITGYLTGFIDLVCEHQGRYYIVDWKTNRLGADDAAYTLDAITSAMEADVYTLQYHLYSVALHRHLAQRLPGYEYARHFGGVVYTFVRGAHAPGHGGFCDRPETALIADLSAAMQ